MEGGYAYVISPQSRLDIVPLTSLVGCQCVKKYVLLQLIAGGIKLTPCDSVRRGL